MICSALNLEIDRQAINSKDLHIKSIKYTGIISNKYTVAVKIVRMNYKKEFLRNDFVSKTATLSFKYNKTRVKYSGVVTDFIVSFGDITGDPKENFTLIIEPNFLGRNARHNKIFLNKSTTDIAKEVIEDNSSLTYSSKVTKNYEARDFCFQYQEEDDKTFLNRLLSEEGIFYYFDQESNSVVLYDSSNSYTDSKLVFTAGFGTKTNEHYTYQIKNFNSYDHYYESPTTDMAVNKANTEEACFDNPSIEIWPYPGPNNKATSDGTACLTTLLDYEKVRSNLFTFNFQDNNNDCVKLDVGSKFKYAKIGSKRAKEYVILSIDLNIKIETDNHLGISCIIDAIEADVVYKPALISAPTIPLMPAEVVGEDESQRTLKDNCAQVKFYWQKDDDETPKNYWLRVAQIWAGKSYGSFFRPVIGTEVIVSFLYGPNRAPVIIGCLHDGALKYPNAEEKFWNGITSKNEDGEHSTELIFADDKDAEKFSINTAKDYESTVQNDKTVTVVKGNDKLIVSEKDRIVEVEKGEDKLTVTEKDKIVEIKKGNENITLEKGDRTIKAEAGKHSISAKTHSIKASETITIDAGTEITLKVGESEIKISNESIKLSAPTIKIEGQAETEISGAITKIEAEGILECLGSIVKIN
jgi:type VI secretion system secreted protein VgrG